MEPSANHICDVLFHPDERLTQPGGLLSLARRQEVRACYYVPRIQLKARR